MSRSPLRPRECGVVEFNHALTGYLDALLAEVPEDNAAHSTPSVNTTSAPPVVDLSPPAATKELTVTPTQALSAAAPVTFKSLCFEIGATHLTAPLDRLGGVIEGADRLTLLPGQAPWICGLLSHRGRHIRVVDLNALMSAEKSTPARAQPPPRPAQYILLIGDTAWGIVCDGIGSVINVTSDQCRTRRGQHAHRWIVGTLTDPLCLLIDIDLLVETLQNATQAGMNDARPVQGR